MPDAREVDPAIFQKDRGLEFAFAITSAAEQFSSSFSQIESYLKVNDPEALAAEFGHVIKSITDSLGHEGITLSGIKVEAISMSGEKDEVSEEDYLSARESYEAAQTNLMGYVFGYHDYLAGHLGAVYDDEEEVEETAWSCSWEKLRDTLQPVGGPFLADVADFFDRLIKGKYGEKYDPIDRLRGPVVSQDISARTFYETMEEHLSRAIMRSGEDGWTGY